MLLILYFAILIVTNNSKCMQYKNSRQLYSRNTESRTLNGHHEYLAPNENKETNSTNKNEITATQTNNLNQNLLENTEVASDIAKSDSYNEHMSKVDTKNLPAHFLDYFNPSNIIRPLAEKISATLTYQPNNGLPSYLNPYYLWKQISDKGQQLLSNTNIAIFGLGQAGAHDYPFPYRGYSPQLMRRDNETTL